jgi:hypothetical protein
VHPELLAESVASQPSNHTHRIAKPCNCHGLICAFAAGMDLKIIPDDRFTHRRNPFGECYKISIDAADDNDWLLPRQFKSPEAHNKALVVLGK